MRSSTPLRVSGMGNGGAGHSGAGTIDFSSEDHRTEAIIKFLRFLLGAAIAYVITSILCVWEFTIGIKKSIKKLYTGKI
jgi:hypothetical protein